MVKGTGLQHTHTHIPLPRPLCCTFEPSDCVFWSDRESGLSDALIRFTGERFAGVIAIRSEVGETERVSG